ncbi:MAG: hypothetical protein ETSY1_19015 [Candidatus Entotheonella factor]|uniref:Uncharacterized protein n=1 Tax=Entotheonella factor TaxID=1429438 RepID=W4LJV0_ENTF1|nr:MAG: hypothetical protein ETSY1_19015 [Candidatus Entotheonella factor]
MYDAVNGIAVASNVGNARTHALVSPSGAPQQSQASDEAAAMAAAHAVLSALYPTMADDYDEALEDGLEALNANANKVAAGVAWGANVGQQVVSLRANDGSSPSETLPGGTAPGQYRADFTSAQFRNMDPFAINSANPYLSSGPPALTSSAYADAWAEVKDLGNAAIPDQNKEEIFRFWRGSGGSARPPGEWLKIAIEVTNDPTYELSLKGATRLFTLLGMALGDAVIPAWDNKFTFRLWRPTTAIREAGTDDNPNTVADPSWNPRNGSIGGSPEHTSGQSTFAGAGSTILAGFYCDDDISFTFEGDNAIAGPRSFASFSAAAAEAGRARIFAGIHFEFSNQGGQSAGQGVGDEILATQLLRLQGQTHNGQGCPL